MATDSTSRTLWLLAGIALLAAGLWLVRDVLPPFLIAAALALLLDPILGRMQQAGLPRWAAAAITFLVFLAALFAAVAILVPLAIAQLSELIRNLPGYTAHLQAAADEWALKNAALLQRLHLPPSLNDLWRDYQQDITRYAQVFLERAFQSLQASAGLLGWMVIIPIVTLYLLADLNALRARIAYLIPDRHRDTVVALAVQVSRVFGAYLRGLSGLCLCYGFIIFLVLEIGVRLNYAVVLGLAAVVLYAVPYLGQITLVALAVLTAWVTGKSPAHIIGLVVSVVVVGQLFDQLITPRVIGKQVGLHPVIGIFALMVGGQLFGLMGMVVAVPVAASVRVVLIQLFPRLAEPIPPELAPIEASSSGPQ